MAADGKKTPTKTPSAPAGETRNLRSSSQLALSQTPAETPDNVNKNESKKQPDDNNPVLSQDAAKAAGKTKSTRSRKRRRKSESAVADDAASSKKPSFERIWSEEDEIKLLNAIIHCVKEHGIDPDSASDQVTEYMRETLNMPFSRRQVYKKARRLKHRWELASAKLKNTGSGPAKAHDQAMFELSQQIWVAPDEARGKARSEAHDEARVATPPAEEEAHVPRSDRLQLRRVVFRVAREKGLDSDTMKLVLRGCRGLPPARVKELEEKWAAHTLEGVKYSLADDKLKSETLRDCVESLERGDL